MNTSVASNRRPLVLLNPGTVRQGSNVGISGSGFDPGAVVDLLFKRKESDQGDTITFVQIDKSGAFGNVAFTVPDQLPTGSFIVEARQRQGEKVGFAVGVVAGGAPKVKMGIQVGKPGDAVELSAQGFSADEDIAVFWNGLDGKSVGALHSDPDGGVAQGTIRVPFGAVGNNSFVFLGAKSQSPVTVPFLLLNLFPSVQLSTYAIRADNVLSFSGKDFGPDESVEVHLNSPDGDPIATVQTEVDGTFTNAGSVLIPFGLGGRQTLIFIGLESRAPATATFDVQPYTPSAQPSTYGGRPGTVVTFYATGFARSEVVLAYTGRTAESTGRLVSCFESDDQGNAGAAGSYMIPPDAAAGQQVFTLIGRKSGGIASTAIEVMASDVPIQAPAPPEFSCPLDMGDDPPPPDQIAIGAPAAMAVPGAAAAAVPGAAQPGPAAPAKPGAAAAQPAPAKPGPAAAQPAPAKPANGAPAKPAAVAPIAAAPPQPAAQAKP
jgi:hypothetical protein